jgi:hypothetical protein
MWNPKIIIIGSRQFIIQGAAPIFDLESAQHVAIDQKKGLFKTFLPFLELVGEGEWRQVSYMK